MFEILKIVGESFFSKIGEKLFECVESLTDNNSTFQALKRKFGSLNNESSDVEEEIDNAELPSTKKIKREVENWGMEVPTTGMLGKGFEDNCESIWKSLREDGVKSIGIYGMGGVGKTTLTRHINNKLVKENQNCVFWVTVSQEYSIRVLQDKIVHLLNLDLSEENDEDRRAAPLNIALSSLRKNVVLILDDMWENISLEKVGNPLCVEGCRLIITTRLPKVCRQIGCKLEIAVKTLDKDEAWNLFSEKFGEEIATLSPQVKEIAKSMVEVCDGLPLGIITLAGSMRGETNSIRGWRNALAELKQSAMDYDEMGEKVFNVLEYSFNRLNPKHQTRGKSYEEYTKLQHCFLYCCLYPEDFEIRRNELVRGFISEQLVDKTKSLGAQIDEGYTMLNKLVNVSLLENVEDDEVVDHRVKMHDLVRAMALKIAEEKYKVLGGCRLMKQIPKEREYWMKKKMSLMWNTIQEIPDGFSPNCPNLTTLLLQNNNLTFISDSFFSKMHGLCVLNLSHNGVITKLPNSLSELKSLQALLLRGCRNLVYVPYLGRLKALKELDLSNTAIKKPPQGMENLLNLTFLSFQRNLKTFYLPKGLLLKFQYLQRLHLPYLIQAPIDEIERLKQLEEFHGRVHDVSDFNRWMRSKQQNQIMVIKIIIQVGRFTNWSKFRVDDDISSVVVSGCNFSQDDMPIMLPGNIQTLQLQKCEGLQINGIECIMEKREIGAGVVALPAPAQAVFSSLTKLNIYSCPKMKKLGLTGSEFPNIEEIAVKFCEDIEEIIEQGDVVHFPKLRTLDLDKLPRLKKLGLTGSEIPNIEIFSVGYCEEIEEIIEQGEGEADPVHFPKLEHLTLCNLPRLKSIYKAIMKSDSIKSISIRRCRELKRIPLYFRKEREAMGISFITSYSPPPTLDGIYLDRCSDEWWDSLEWDHPDHKGLLQPSVGFIFK